MLRHLLTLAAICLYTLSLSTQDCQHPDVPALRAIYDATGGPSWTVNEGWNDLDNCTPCSWSRITCENDRVTGLDFRDNNLRLKFPDVFDQLPMLKELQVSNSFVLAAPIPPTLLAHNTLRRLEIRQSVERLILPEIITGWQSLETLIITNHRLANNLPTNLFQLPALDTLLLDQNRLSGPLPDQLNASSSISYVQITRNNLMGCYPSDLEVFTNQVPDLDLSNNRLLPWLGDWTNAVAGEEQIGAPCLLFTGPPNAIDENCNCRSEFDFCEDFTTQRLLYLYTELGGENWTNNNGWAEAFEGGDCNHCEWYGINCDEQGQLVTIDLSDNDLTGQLNGSILNLVVFDTINLSGNQLSGEITDDFSSVLRSTEFVDLSNNQFSGPTPNSLVATVPSADFSNNNFSGCLSELVTNNCGDAYTFSNNPLLPFEGDISAICAAETQIGAPCRNDATDGPDVIGEDCSCGLPGPPATTFTGQIATPVNETPIPAANISVAGTDGAGPPSVLSDAAGNFAFAPYGFTSLTPSFNVFFPSDIYFDASLGITTTDLLLLQFHLLDIAPLDETQLVAADLSGDGEITIQDLLIMRRIILGLNVSQQDPALDGGWWRYRVLPFEELPQSGGEPQTREVVIEAIKLGDLNFSY